MRICFDLNECWIRSPCSVGEEELLQCIRQCELATWQILIGHGNCYNIDFKHNLNIDLSTILQHCVNVQ